MRYCKSIRSCRGFQNRSVFEEKPRYDFTPLDFCTNSWNFLFFQGSPNYTYANLLKKNPKYIWISQPQLIEDDSCVVLCRAPCFPQPPPIPKNSSRLSASTKITPYRISLYGIAHTSRMHLAGTEQLVPVRIHINMWRWQASFTCSLACAHLCGRCK